MGFESYGLCIVDKINSHTISYLKGTGHICLAVSGPNRMTTSIQSWIKSREIRLRGHVRKEIHEGFWWGNRQVNRNLRRPGRGWEVNIQTDIRVIGREEEDWIDLAQDRDKWRDAFNAITNLPIV